MGLLAFFFKAIGYSNWERNSNLGRITTMKKWILVIALALVFALPLGTLANAAPEEVDVFKANKDGGFHKGGWVHHEMYLSLLIERYAPETTADWAPVLAEKKRLTEEMRAFYKENPDRAKKEIKQFKKQKKDNGTMDAKRSAFRESHQRFDEAVQSRDDNRIREALREQLDNLKEHNKQLASRLAELKKE